MIEATTGVFIDFDTLMKYERGEREPDVSKLIGIAVTLFGNEWSERLTQMLQASIPGNSQLFSLDSLTINIPPNGITKRESIEGKIIETLNLIRDMPPTDSTNNPLLEDVKAIFSEADETIERIESNESSNES